jgi:formyltetrahydrofolate-dependent phosphoribosylglycinamide formyltransferase
MSENIKIAVLLSGSGTNLQRIIDDIENNILKNCEICVVVSNKITAHGLMRAKNQNIQTSYFPFIKDKEERSGYDKLLAYNTLFYNPDIVVLAGWMHILSDVFLQHFPHIINLHPALPGEFPGANAIEDAYKASRKWYSKQEGSNKKIDFKTGAMCHKVIEEIDAGEVLASKSFSIAPSDSLEDVRKQMKIIEKDVLIEGLYILMRQLRENGCDGGGGGGGNDYE